MDKKQNKVVEFLKNHKKEITIAVCSTVAIGGGIMLVVLGKKSELPDSWAAGTIHTPVSKDIKVENWSLGTLVECWREDGGINSIVEGLTVADAGKLGEEFIKIDGVTPETRLCAIVGLSNDNVQL